MKCVLQGEEFKDAQRRFAKYQAEARANPTPAEAAVKRALDSLGIKYVFQKGFLREKTIRLVDFYIAKPNKIFLEVDGPYHERQKEYDEYREKQIVKQRGKTRNLGFLRITNDWVFAQKDLKKSLTYLIAKHVSEHQRGWVSKQPPGLPRRVSGVLL